MVLCAVRVSMGHQTRLVTVGQTVILFLVVAFVGAICLLAMTTDNLGPEKTEIAKRSLWILGLAVLGLFGGAALIRRFGGEGPDEDSTGGDSHSE